MSAGGSQSKQTSESTSSSFIAGNQLPFLNDLWRRAQGATNEGQATEISQSIAGFLGPQFQNAIGGLEGLMDTSGQVAAQTESLQAGLGDLFRNEINPAIRTNAIAAGGLGGGRQGVAEGVAAGQLADAYTQGYGDIVSNANRTALGAFGALPGLGQAYGETMMAPATAGLDPLTRLAAILGSPAILQRSTQESRGKSASFEFSFPGFGG